MSPADYSKEELVEVLEKLKKEYPAVYRSFILYDLDHEEYELEWKRIYGE